MRSASSSIMPQKRNPYGLNVTRLAAGDTLGAATTFLLEAYNVSSGMPDHKREGSQRPLDADATMFRDVSALIRGLVINPERARVEVDGDYSTTTELADVPFRAGHHFAANGSWLSGRQDALQRVQAALDEAFNGVTAH